MGLIIIIKLNRGWYQTHQTEPHVIASVDHFNRRVDVSQAGGMARDRIRHDHPSLHRRLEMKDAFLCSLNIFGFDLI